MTMEKKGNSLPLEVELLLYQKIYPLFYRHLVETVGQGITEMETHLVELETVMAGAQMKSEQMEPDIYLMTPLLA